ncbi:MAG: Uma2 family endonuclease [Bryobacteraceae bacterium]|jgi:Uma2 family endonuclease
MSAQAIPFLTPEQYLEIDRAAERRSEYLDGHIYAMAGGSRTHSYLAVAIAAELRQALRNRGCEVGNSDLRVRVSERGPYFYPDAVVSGGDAETAGDDDIALNPTLIVEVLSKSTEAFDRGDKFAWYRKIESLREYVLISQTSPRVETFVRSEQGGWTFTEFAGPEAICRFASVDCSIPVAAIYQGIKLEQAS